MNRISSPPILATFVLFGLTAAVVPANAASLDDMVSRGGLLAAADPLSAELRNRSPDDLNRRGFDIGMAAAEGNTEPGPGKQRIHDSLSQAEQGGFDAAVSFSLQRNKNARFAAVGAAIAQADPEVAQARSADPDVFYWLGFDIASGIFGDPALGANGNTATGPGSLGIRNALNPAAQRGFDASVALHLRRRGPQPTGLDPAAQVVSAGGKAERTSAVLLAQIVPRVPNLTGLTIADAHNIVSRAGLTSKFTYLTTGDPTVLYNHVGATNPAAGEPVPSRIVEFLIPRPATRDGIGALSLSDVIRRDGFDLDEGRYEGILRGADVVLREDQTPIPHVDINGRTYYTFKGLFVEPSDGAVFAVAPNDGLSGDEHPGGLGSAYNYDSCMRAFAQNRVPYLNLPRGDAYGHDLLFCVQTSRRQIAVVQFRNNDMQCCGGSNYKFHIALYPQQVSQELRARKP